mgnify:CR=1 FL=1
MNVNPKMKRDSILAKALANKLSKRELARRVIAASDTIDKWCAALFEVGAELYIVDPTNKFFEALGRSGTSQSTMVKILERAEEKLLTEDENLPTVTIIEGRACGSIRNDVAKRKHDLIDSLRENEDDDQAFIDKSTERMRAAIESGTYCEKLPCQGYIDGYCVECVDFDQFIPIETNETENC